MEFESNQCGNFAMFPRRVMPLKQLCTPLHEARASLDTVTPIPPTSLPLVRGAEMRVAETRAVNRALRKAYGIGLCSVEELGSAADSAQPQRQTRKFPPQPANGNYGGPKVR